MAVLKHIFIYCFWGPYWICPDTFFFSVAEVVPVGEVVGMAVDRVGCGGKTDGEVEDGSSDMDTDQKFCCQSSDMDIDQKLSRILLL